MQRKLWASDMLPRRINPTLKVIVQEFERRGSMTKHQVSEAVRVDKRNVLEYLQILHADGRIFIYQWVMHRNKWIPCWRLRESEDDQDAVKPRPMTACEQMKKWRRENKERARANQKRQRSAKALGIPITSVRVYHAGVLVG